ncbi:MAG: hypothetical protein GAK28_01565 [Luteibacter sp.]|uniref:ricin-type beta-trefoil lectin domain protein n=1 Tax=Luteibacter sp. TaxID=1886636 RepID=UPI00138512F1|nr:ricin-type beta-trefoil lectin domain protein [Luteibacter sp.]KAF1007609.1 MAG: hypothetical protein GAK28_01565 [Luteibacter sp.]
MKHRYLPASIAAGLLLQCAFPYAASAAPLSPVPVANLSVALAPGAHSATADRWVTEKLEHRVIWLDEAELDEPSMHAFALDSLASGLAVLVTTRQDRPHEAIQRADFISPTRRTIYRQDADGAFASASVPDDMDAWEAAVFMAEWLDRDLVFHDVPEDEPGLLFDDAPTARRWVDSEQTSYVPRKPFRKQTFPLANGQSITYDISVVRDLTANSDQDRKLIAVQARMNLRPGRNLAWWNGTFRERKGSHFFIPKSYDVAMNIQALSGSPTIDLSDFQPRNAKPTSQRIDTQLSIQSASGSGLAPDILDLLIGAGTDPVGALSKLPSILIPDSNATTTETKTLSMQVDDYWVSARTPTPTSLSWSFELSPEAEGPVEVEVNGKKVTKEKFADGTHPSQGYTLYSVDHHLTPMMKSAAIETGAIWMVPASWTGKLAITTDVSILNRVYFHKRLTGKPFQSLEKDDLAPARHTIEIDLDSPLLTRTPTVRLQSFSGESLCLAQPDKAAPGVAMQVCTEGEDGRQQQWHLDARGTYRNRDSGWCLTARMGDGGAEARPCRENLRSQEWIWAADRLASKVNGGDLWRLHLRDGVPRAEMDTERHSRIVWNRYHTLLKPWLNYPYAPTATDREPGPNGLSTPIPVDYLGFKNVTLEERWEAKPVTPSP